MKKTPCIPPLSHIKNSHLLAVMLPLLLLLPLASSGLAQGQTTESQVSPDPDRKAMMAWFPGPKGPWTAYEAEVLQEAPGLMQLQRRYHRPSDQASMTISVMATTSARSKGQQMWRAVAKNLGARPVKVKGVEGMLLAADGKTVAKFILSHGRIEIDIAVDRQEPETVMEMANRLALDQVEEIFLKDDRNGGQPPLRGSPSR